MIGELRPAAGEPRRGRPIAIEVAAGDLVDKPTVPEIKAARSRDEANLRHVRAELAAFQAAYARAIESSPAAVGRSPSCGGSTSGSGTWRTGCGGASGTRTSGRTSIEPARQVYRQDDRRAALQRRISEASGSRSVEEKSDLA